MIIQIRYKVEYNSLTNNLRYLKILLVNIQLRLFQKNIKFSD
jgi:hypothetical protein